MGPGSVGKLTQEHRMQHDGGQQRPEQARLRQPRMRKKTDTVRAPCRMSHRLRFKVD